MVIGRWESQSLMEFINLSATEQNLCSASRQNCHNNKYCWRDGLQPPRKNQLHCSSTKVNKNNLKQNLNVRSLRVAKLLPNGLLCSIIVWYTRTSWELTEKLNCSINVITPRIDFRIQAKLFLLVLSQNKHWY